jgi:hypothetical protein
MFKVKMKTILIESLKTFLAIMSISWVGASILTLYPTQSEDLWQLIFFGFIVMLSSISFIYGIVVKT